MTRALLYKEWIKLRLWWTLMLAASVAFALFLFFKLRYVVNANEAVTVWSTWIFKGWLFFRPFQYAPLVFGVTLGFLQFLPEVQAQRIRLALHLPLGETRAIALHLAAGALLLALVLLPAALVFSLGGALWFPGEWQGNLFRVFTPWILTGYGAYLAAAAILLETNWRHRVFYLLLSAGALRLFLLETAYDTYARILPALALWVLALVLVPLFSSHRFRKGLAR
ncbi:hypothetical protein OH491_02975 [Termitidicoccus mucosus]|uniref:Uncharacterized protein n=1 Tax=Termitidicoccus mucosus TaxID=1184151 RepID=A0A178INC8_9BACT|nr:hypothetical protein AW736_06580 [Opitutaceae bacterium TSB47]